MKKLLVLLLLVFAPPTYAGQETWTNIDATVSVSKDGKLLVGYETRWVETFENQYLYNYYVGVSRKVYVVDFMVAYKREVVRSKLHENRIILGLLYKWESFDFRFLAEFRSWEEDIDSWTRLRLRGRYVLGLKIVQPYIGYELLYNDVRHKVDRSRFIVGISKKFGVITPFVGYLKDDVFDVREANSLHLGFKLSF